MTVLDFLDCFFLLTNAKTTTITTITTMMMAAKIIGLDKTPSSLAETVVGVGVAVAIVGVGVAAVSTHHWFIEEASKADTSACKSCTLKPAFTPAGSVNIWLAATVIELFVY